MRPLHLTLCLLLIVATGCSNGGAVSAPALPLAGAKTALDLSPAPVDLNNDNPAKMFTVQNDTPGLSYSASASPGCVGPTGGMYVAGDGQSQTAAAGTPMMFLVYAIGTAPATCTIVVGDSSGNFGTVDATYETLTVQSHRRIAMSVTPGVTPASVTITKANQVVTLAISGFTGTTTASAGSCATGTSGIAVHATNPVGGYVVVPFGIGAIAKSCTVTISDTAGNSATVAVTLAIPALNKFTASVVTMQFGCAGTTAPLHCRTIQTVTLSETGATAFQIAPRAFPLKSCVDKFVGPLKFVGSSGALSLTAAGPSATVAFDGLLNGTNMTCSVIPISDGGDPAQIVTVAVNSTLATAPPPAIATAAAPPCVGNDPFVAVPSGPHGMFVWAPSARAVFLLQKYSIGKDPALCGASLVVDWSDLEKSKGVFDFPSVETAAAPFTSAGLTVNLLFAEATEGVSNTVTPPWVLAEVPTSSCGGPQMPAYWNATYEADWSDFIAHAIAYFSNTSSIKNNIGYMRFATGGGAEALPPSGYSDGGTCQAVWAGLGYSYTTWMTHELNILNAMAATPSTHQIMASLPEVPVPSTTSIYEMPNAFAAVAASKHIGLSFESLGSGGITGPTTTPARCNPAAKIIVLHWCQAYINYAGVVPLAMQPITATTSTSVSVIDISKLLPYALDNNIQIFELYPEEWLEADSGPEWAPFDPTNQAKYQTALKSASLVLGATNGH